MLISTIQQAKERYDNYVNLAESERITVQEKFQTLFETLLPDYVAVVHLHSNKITVWRKDDLDWEKSGVVFEIHDHQCMLDTSSYTTNKQIDEIYTVINKILFGN